MDAAPARYGLTVDAGALCAAGSEIGPAESEPAATHGAEGLAARPVVLTSMVGVGVTVADGVRDDDGEGDPDTVAVGEPDITGHDQVGLGDGVAVAVELGDGDHVEEAVGVADTDVDGLVAAVGLVVAAALVVAAGLVSGLFGTTAVGVGLPALGAGCAAARTSRPPEPTVTPFAENQANQDRTTAAYSTDWL